VAPGCVVVRRAAPGDAIPPPRPLPPPAPPICRLSGRCETETETDRRASADCRYSTRSAAAQRDAASEEALPTAHVLNWTVGGLWVVFVRTRAELDGCALHRWLMVRHGIMKRLISSSFFFFPSYDFAVGGQECREARWSRLAHVGMRVGWGRGVGWRSENPRLSTSQVLSFVLLSFVQWCWLVLASAGSSQEQNCFLFFFLGGLPWFNVDTPLSAHTI
jgi:hypothetical protein